MNNDKVMDGSEKDRIIGRIASAIVHSKARLRAGLNRQDYYDVAALDSYIQGLTMGLNIVKTQTEFDEITEANYGTPNNS